jgi:hypothetical protein
LISSRPVLPPILLGKNRPKSIYNGKSRENRPIFAPKTRFSLRIFQQPAPHFCSAGRVLHMLSPLYSEFRKSRNFSVQRAQESRNFRKFTNCYKVFACFGITGPRTLRDISNIRFLAPLLRPHVVEPKPKVLISALKPKNRRTLRRKNRGETSRQSR